MSGGFPSIAADLHARGVQLAADAIERLESYADLLLHWNRRINLVGAPSAEVLWRRHLLDCLLLEAVPIPPRLRRWVDLGSGAGLPAVTLAIAAPGRQVVAVESVARKATFLREVARRLALPNLTVLHHDAQRLPDADVPLPCDAMVARAFAPLPALLALAERLLPADAELWAMKGRNWPAEAAAVPDALRVSFGAPAVHAQGPSDGVVLVYRRAAGGVVTGA